MFVVAKVLRGCMLCVHAWTEWEAFHPLFVVVALE